MVSYETLFNVLDNFRTIYGYSETVSTTINVIFQRFENNFLVDLWRSLLINF